MPGARASQDGPTESPAERVRRRVAAYDWSAVARDLDERGHARLPALLTPGECRELVSMYADRSRFRSFVDLERHRFGEAGDYRYFGPPLPALVRALRVRLYAKLAPIANRWQEELGSDERFPKSLSAFLDHCHEHGQARPTPLLLRYRTGGSNFLHQDLYGAVAFPLQVTCLLSRPVRDFRGGQFLLTEQRPRMQSRGEAVELARGEGVVFPNRDRPVRGARGTYRARTRHGMSRVHEGERYALGLIFHDAD